MKSVLITALMFLALIAAIHFGVFNALSSKAAYLIAFALLAGAVIAAFKVLGNPLKKDDGHDKE